MLVYYFNLNDVKHEWSEHASETAVDRRRLRDLHDDDATRTSNDRVVYFNVLQNSR